MLTRLALTKTASVTPDQVRAACNSSEFYYVLNDALGSQGASAMQGGCRVVAEALQELLGGTIMAAVSNRGDDYDYSKPFVDHYVLDIGGGRYLDGDGIHSQHDIEYQSFGIPTDFRNLRLVEATHAIREWFGSTIWSSPAAVNAVADYIDNYS